MIVMLAKLGQFLPRIVQGGKPLHVQTLVRNRPLKLSMNPFSTGLRSTTELTAAVHGDAFGQAASFVLRPFQCLGHFRPRHRPVCF